MCFSAPWSALLAVSLTDLFKAGMLAGEGLGGVLQALLAVAKVDGSRECPAYAPVGDGFLRSTCLTLSQRRIWHCDRMSWIRVLRMKMMNTGPARWIEYGLYGLTVMSAM